MAEKNRLHVKRLDTIGFVDRGDNTKAEVVFFKRKVEKMIREEGGKFCVYSEDGSKKLGEHDDRAGAEAQMRAMEADKTEKSIVARVMKALGLEKQVAKLIAEGAAGGSIETELEPAPTTTEDHPMFDVKKLDAAAQAEFQKLTDRIAALEPKAEPKLPADVQKKLDDASEEVRKAHDRIEKLEDQREVEKFVGIAKSLGLTADDWAAPLRKIAKALTADEWKAFETHEKALQAQIRAGALYKQIGTGGHGSATEAETELHTAVAEVRKAKPELTVEEATGEVMKTNVALRNRLESERLSRTPQAKED